jgi:hypothetical protein
MAPITAGRPSGVPNPSQHGNGEVEGDIELDGEGAPGAERPHVGSYQTFSDRFRRNGRAWRVGGHRFGCGVETCAGVTKGG